MRCDRNVTKPWAEMGVLNWAAALNRFAIIYEDRLPPDHRPG